MWNNRTVHLEIRLPNDLADEAEEVQRSDPDFLSRIIQYGLTRRSIYRRLRDVENADQDLDEAAARTSFERSGSDSFIHP